jgi:hypothetical protein
MQRRIYGVETEYAVSLEAADRGLLASDQGALFNALEQALLARFDTLEADSFGRLPGSGRADGIEIREGRFLESGARFYYDAGHVEWATPECTTPRAAVVYELAGERTLSELARELPLPAGTRLLLLKNNVDYAGGATFGCHENYLVARGAGKAADDALFRRLVAQLVPFLVTRQIFAGAGKLGAAGAQERVGYQISQRADFITTVISPETRSARAIVNQRDESLGDARRYRRLHLIVGDSNRSAWANFLKLATTGLVIELIENRALAEVPELADPVAAIKAVSRDLTCRQPIPLRGGGSLGPIDVQYRYLRCAERFVERHQGGGESEQILACWRGVLDDLAADPVRVAGRVDWMIKRHHLFEPRLRETGTGWERVGAWGRLLAELERDRGQLLARLPVPSAEQCARLQFYLDRHGLRWQDYPAQRRLHFELRERDLRYHDIDPDRGLFAALERAGVAEPLVEPREVLGARVAPPSDTRARLRAEVIRWAHRQGHRDTLLDWGKVTFPQPGGTVQLDDPFCATRPELERLLRETPASDRTDGAGGEAEIPIRILGVTATAETPAERATRWLRKLLG